MTETPSPAETIIGIDLGTTNSEVAVWAGDRVVVIADSSGQRILPSVVGLADDGAILVGEAARNQYPLYPERTARSVKRLMGSEQTVQLGTTTYTPQEISAVILRRLKALAEAHLGHPVAKAVITVPAYFSDAQRQATREAGQIAGLEVMRIINEPTAAALAYEANHQGHRHILVYDLGGGTFDVSVVKIQDGVVEVLASHGNNQLGGDDFDQKIIDHLLAHLSEQHHVDASQSRQAMARLGRAAEAAKIALSSTPYAMVEEEYLLERDGEPVNLSLELDRVGYEAMIEGYIDETLEAVHIALQGAKLTVSDIHEILLVGGATRTPLISERLEEEFDQQPRGEVDPDLCVAMGAAIQAAMIAGHEVSAVLVDITPYTFGTSALGEVNGVFSPNRFVPIIHKNSPIPITRSEGFLTITDNQEAVEVNAFQGEDPDASNNIPIGQFIIGGLSKVPAGNRIIMELALDLDGVLQVSAIEKSTGLSKSITIDNALRRYDEEELAKARSRIGALFEGEALDEDDDDDDEDDGVAGAAGQQSHQTIVQARALVEKAERMLEGATPEDREDMINLIETVRDALAGNQPEALAAAVEELSEILYYLDS